MPRNAARLQPREAVLNSEEFKALWERIKHRTTYRVRFDNDTLARTSVPKALSDAPFITARHDCNGTQAGMRH